MTSKNLQEFVTRSIGSIGIGQILILCACKLPIITSAMSMFAVGFYSYAPDWWRIRKVYNETSGNYTIYKDFRKCPIESTDHVVFDPSFRTIVSEWNLICSDVWIPTTIQTIQMVGVLFGAMIFGHIGDYYGRKRVLQSTQALQIVTLVVQAFSYSWHMFLVTSIFLGISLGGFFLVIYVYLMEFVNGKWRTILPSLPSFALGIMLFGGAIYGLPNWKHLCLLTAGLATPIFIITLLSPRSPRWLFTHDKVDEGKHVITSLAKINKRQEPTFDDLDEIIKMELAKEASTKFYNFFTLMKFPSTRKKVILLGFSWFTHGFSYYALTLGVGTLSGNIAENYVYIGLTGMFNAPILYAFTIFFGRKHTSMILACIVSVTSFSISVSYFAIANADRFLLVMKILAHVSRLFLGVSWYATGIYSVESFPTVIRVAGLASVYTMARIGGILAPQNKTLFDISKHLPFTLIGILALITCILLSFLKDTHNLPMEDYIEEETPVMDEMEFLNKS